jgi:hypothetical protein
MRYVRAMVMILLIAPAIIFSCDSVVAQQAAPAASYTGTWRQNASSTEPCSGREAFPSEFVFDGAQQNGYLNGSYKIACVNRVGISGQFRFDGAKPYAQIGADGKLGVYMPAATYNFGPDGLGGVSPAAGGSYPLNMKR